MPYVENTYICLAAPLLVAILGLKNPWRRVLIFLLAGMTCWLLSAYISSFFSTLTGLDTISTSHEISPAVEEFVKFLPVFFYLAIFTPEKGVAIGGIITVAVGFATFENICFLTTYGTSDLLMLLIRGFGTGAMHVLCGMMVAISLYYMWDHSWLRVAGVFGAICSAITFHAIFNVTVSVEGVSLWVGSFIPMTVIIIVLICFHKLARRNPFLDD